MSNSGSSITRGDSIDLNQVKESGSINNKNQIEANELEKGNGGKLLNNNSFDEKFDSYDEEKKEKKKLT